MDVVSPVPVALFAYNRPRHLQRVVEALGRAALAADTELFVYADGPRHGRDEETVAQVRRYLRGIGGFKRVEIIERERNLGLARSVVAGVSELIDRYGALIVLEDDLVVAPRFLWLLNRLLATYQDEKSVFSLTGYNYPDRRLRIPSDYPYTVYFSPRLSSWGWASWSDRWSRVDWDVSDFGLFMRDPELRRRFDQGGADRSELLQQQMAGKVDSWGIRFNYASFKLGAYHVYPVRSLVDNIGLDGSGVHCRTTNGLQQELDLTFPERLHLPQRVEVDPRILSRLQTCFSRSLLSRVRRKLRAAGAVLAGLRP